jgi:CubicO group peptidase (beta-lactamase class C family)
VSGKPYGQYLKDEFFTPLGLTGTVYCDQAPLIKHRAQGYGPTPGGQFVNAEPLSMTQPYAAGSLCSTVTDLAAWTAALAGGKVVSPASYRQMSTPGTLNDGKPLSYGFGLGVGALRGHRQVSHNGGINGFVSELHHYVDDSVVVVVLTNVGNATAPQLERVIATRALAIPDTAAAPLGAADLARYAGTYALPRLRIRMFADSGRLSSQGEGQGVVRLKHLGGGRFVAEDNDNLRVEFPAEGTPAPSFVLRQGGNVTTATRVP